MTLHTLNTGEPNDWIGITLPTVLNYAKRHHYGIKVWGAAETEGLPHPKFIIVRLLREFLATDQTKCLWVDADVWIHPEAPAIHELGCVGWRVAHDAWCRAGILALREWATQCDAGTVREGWIYRNAGVWMCDRLGAEEFLKTALPPYRLGVMDQNQLNVWWSRIPEELMGVLPVEWNRAVKRDLNFAWFQHLCGSDKLAYWERLTGSEFQQVPAYY